MVNGRKKSTLPERIGIGSTFVYYLGPVDWRELFQRLGYEVVVSGPSTYETFEEGARYSANDQCFPLKVYLGHLAKLAGKVDFIFIPQFVSLKNGTYRCPKIIGLPLLVRHSVSKLPPVLTVSIDLNSPAATYIRMLAFIVKLSKHPLRAYNALRLLREAKKELPPVQGNKQTASNGKVIGILGHEYALKDSFLNLRVADRIRQYGFEVRTGGHIEADNSVEYFNCRTVHWDFGQNIVAAAEAFLKDDGVAGIVFLSYFGCGIDAFVEEIFKKSVGEKKPYLCLVLDEHSGEAGILTRIEAYLDMLNRRNELVRP